MNATARSRPDTIHRSCPICEASCGIVVAADHGRGEVFSIRGDPDDPRSRGYICPKAQAIKGVHEDPDRIRGPLRRTGSTWEEIGWEEALEWTGERLREIRATHGNDAIGTYIGNPTGHDFGAMLYTTFFIQALSTQRVFTGSTVDQFPKNLSCRLMFGDAWMFPIPDIDRTDFFLVMGANPLVSQGSLMSAPNMRARLQAHRARGGRLVVVDPRRSETAAMADSHIFIRPGSDAFLLFAMINQLFSERWVNLGRLADFTDGVEVLRELADPFTPEAVAPVTGIDPGGIRKLTREFAAAKRAICYGRFGTCTQRFGTLASWLVDAVNILTGNFDRPGGMMFPRPATGQCEPVATDSGPVPYDRFQSRVRGFPEFDGQLPVSVMAEEIDSAGEERMRAMITVAGNPVLSTPNGERLRRAFEMLDLMVAIDIYMNETTCLADIILPTTTHLEHENFDFLFQTTSVRNMVHYSPQVLEAPPDTKHHWEVILEVAARLNGVSLGDLDDLMVGGVLATFVGLPGTPAEHLTPAEARKMIGDHRGPERLLDAMLRAGPYGDGFVDADEGLSLEKLRKTRHAVDLGPLEPRLPEILRTPGRRIPLAHQLLVDGVEGLRESLREGSPDPGVVLIGRRQIQNMNSWLHNLPVLARGKTRCTLLVNPEDAGRLRLEDGDTARVRSRVGEVVVPVVVTDEMMPGVVSLPHGFGHDATGTRLSVARAEQPGANANALADEMVLDELSGTSVLNGIPVTVTACERDP
jgi:anaerobic selenocysteine-containing dehydrogenase